MPRTVTASKRVIIQSTRGPHPGLYTIAGLMADLQAHVRLPGIPAYCPNVDFGDRRSDLELVRSTDTYVLYRELVPTALPSVDDDGA